MGILKPYSRSKAKPVSVKNLLVHDSVLTRKISYNDLVIDESVLSSQGLVNDNTNDDDERSITSISTDDDEEEGKKDTNFNESSSSKRQKLSNQKSLTDPQSISPEYERFLNSLDLETDCLYQPFRQPINLSSSNENGETANQMSIDIDLSQFEDELKCPICLGEIDKTWTVMACLHRFCGECLHRCLRVYKSVHECPNCRTKIASRRSSISDTNYDEIIQILLNKSDINPSVCHSTSQLSEQSMSSSKELAMTDIRKYQKLHEQSIAKFREKQLLIKEKHKEDLLRRSKSMYGNNQIISMSLLPWIDNDSSKTLKYLKRPYLKVPGLMKVKDIKDYLVLLSPWNDSHVINSSLSLDIGLRSGNSSQVTVLNDTLTLMEICKEQWDCSNPFELLYRLSKAKESVEVTDDPISSAE